MFGGGVCLISSLPGRARGVPMRAAVQEEEISHIAREKRAS